MIDLTEMTPNRFYGTFWFTVFEMQDHLRRVMEQRQLHSGAICFLVRFNFNYRRYGKVLGMRNRSTLIKDENIVKNIMWVMRQVRERKFKVFKEKFNFLEGLK